MDKSAWYRKIPKVDILLEMPEIRLLREKYGHEIVMDKIRVQMEELRRKIGAAGSEEELEAAGESIRALPQAIEESVQEQHKPRVRKVINATGTILHTNLGRAPISREQAEKLTDIVTGYSNLEYDLAAGRRGERYSHFAQLLCRLTGAEDAMVVNNNAAAVMLVLSTLAKGGEVIVSRGELVEIGGKFRVPDVMAASGADLVEVGTTNKTHFSDYKEALTERTKALLKVHTSNYRIVGFTESVGIDELKPLAEAHGIPVIEDLGSGVLIDLEKYGLHHEPTVQESIRAGADVVCFSGDKLLGGPQAGIIIGKKKYIQAMKKNQLTRALRVDKFTVTALELVLL
ncbi:MAG: L-seryl-tRNA(Sec) selenium transferase, partial [Lachnospiraceae bacterium]|nr:L-seryl-tRNA(Sec) selenium transferase [Lachnospiraceae bacterium]